MKLVFYRLINYSILIADGSSYFSAYVEKVAVGSQTDSDKDKEHLEDMVTAFQMQNKFLNKVSFIRLEFIISKTCLIKGSFGAKSITTASH